jgi:hypothetical protein
MTRALVLAATLLLSAGSSSAVPLVVYSNFGPDDSFWNTIHDVVNQGGFLEHGARFTIPSGPGFHFTGVDLVISDVAGESTLHVTLWSDSNGSPGAIMEDIRTGVDLTSTPQQGQFQHVASTVNTILSGGDSYWISLSVEAGGRVGWKTNNTGASFIGVKGEPGPDATWTVINDPVAAPQGTFRVLGAIIPEPSTAALLGLGLVGLAAGRRRTVP